MAKPRLREVSDIGANVLPKIRALKGMSRIPPPAEGLFRIRVGVGLEPGFIKIGPEWDAPDHVVDTKAMPWPIDGEAVDALYSSFNFHRLTRDERYAFMDEAYRVLKKGAQLSMVMPHWSSMRAITDPLCQWPPLCESSFMVYSRKWREQEKMLDLPLVCDFADVYGYGTSMDQDFGGRNDEYLQHARKHWLNANLDLHVTLTKP